jgi:hypothetical protein
MSPIPADLVAVREGCKQDFLKRHQKDRKRAMDAWDSLVAKERHLRSDTAFGPLFDPPKLPAFLKGIWPLRLIKGLPHAFRAVYTIVHDPSDGVVVRVEWVGSHAEYDALFGYATS